MSSPRLWALILALTSFLAGGASTALVTGWMRRPPAPSGPFAAYERELVATYELEPERARLLHELLLAYDKEIQRARDAHVAELVSELEPRLRTLGLQYRAYIRDHVLPPDQRLAFDRDRSAQVWGSPTAE